MKGVLFRRGRSSFLARELDDPIVESPQDAIVQVELAAYAARIFILSLVARRGWTRGR